MQILVVEDEPKVGQALREGLVSEGYEVAVAPTSEEGFFQASAGPFDLMILDVMLPGRDGIEVLQMLRKQGMKTPVLLLTAKDAIEDRVLGLDAGACRWECGHRGPGQRDNDPGIPPEHAEKVFERFYRVNKARSRVEGGAGLGLSIVQWSVSAHGGRVGLDRNAESGCAFVIHLPLEDVHRPVRKEG